MKSEPENQPDELGELSALVKEFVSRLQNVDNEMELLKESRKELVDEFSSKLDVKVLNQVLRVIKIKSKIDHKHTFDQFMEILETE